MWNQRQIGWMAIALVAGGCVTTRPPVAKLALGPDVAVEIRSGPVRPKQTTWYEARETSGRRVLTSFSLVFFDDVNADGLAQPGEVLLRDELETKREPSSVVRLRSLARCVPDWFHRLRAMARVTTMSCPQGREVIWELSSGAEDG